jgi:hypothetical protein
MSTMTDERVSLDWVTFAKEEPTDPCECTDGDVPCPHEAISRVILDRGKCTCGKDSILVCLKHKDILLDAIRKPGAELRCSECDAYIRVIRFDVLR